MNIVNHTSHVTRHTSHVTTHLQCHFPVLCMRVSRQRIEYCDLFGTQVNEAGNPVSEIEVYRKEESGKKVTRHTSQVVRHTSHVKCHRSHITRPISHVQYHTLHDVCYLSNSNRFLFLILSLLVQDLTALTPYQM